MAAQFAKIGDDDDENCMDTLQTGQRDAKTHKVVKKMETKSQPQAAAAAASSTSGSTSSSSGSSSSSSNNHDNQETSSKV